MGICHGTDRNAGGLISDGTLHACCFSTKTTSPASASGCSSAISLNVTCSRDPLGSDMLFAPAHTPIACSIQVMGGENLIEVRNGRMKCRLLPLLEEQKLRIEGVCSTLAKLNVCWLLLHHPSALYMFCAKVKAGFSESFSHGKTGSKEPITTQLGTANGSRSQASTHEL